MATLWQFINLFHLRKYFIYHENNYLSKMSQSIIFIENTSHDRLIGTLLFYFYFYILFYIPNMKNKICIIVKSRLTVHIILRVFLCFSLVFVFGVFMLRRRHGDVLLLSLIFLKIKLKY
jgi:hypothetical protein